jgi:hypothetical protein
VLSVADKLLNEIRRLIVRDLLMFAPSFNHWPVAPVEFARSEPAKSIRLREIRPEFIAKKTSDPT